MRARRVIFCRPFRRHYETHTIFLMELGRSSKGGELVHFHGYTYRKDKVRLNVVTWRCVKEKCKGRLTTSLQYADNPEDEGVRTVETINVDKSN